MKDIEAWNHVTSREFATKQQVGNPCSGAGDGFDHAVDDAKPVTGQQVIGQRVAGEPFGHGEDEEDEPDHPVDFARLAEGAGEEDAKHVQPDCGDKQQRCPVVHLAHEQTAADVKRDVERGRIRRGHLEALEWDVRTFIVNFDHRGVVKERQEGAGQEDDDEGIQRDFAEHERPVVGEDFAAQELHSSGQAGALVDVVRHASDYAHSTSRGRCFRVLLLCCDGHRTRSQ